jgi:hypothetical protein
MKQLTYVAAHGGGPSVSSLDRQGKFPSPWTGQISRLPPQKLAYRKTVSVFVILRVLIVPIVVIATLLRPGWPLLLDG